MKEIVHSRGDTRADGYRFWQYQKMRQGVYESWRSPESYARAVETTKRCRMAWHRRQAVKPGATATGK